LPLIRGVLASAWAAIDDRGHDLAARFPLFRVRVRHSQLTPGKAHVAAHCMGGGDSAAVSCAGGISGGIRVILRTRESCLGRHGRSPARLGFQTQVVLPTI